MMRSPTPIALAFLAFYLCQTSLAVSTISAAGFIASDKSVTFALNIPQADDNNDLYFTLSGPSASSWIAVGMGSNKMDNSMIFMMYADSTGSNITLSPRFGNGNYEPSYTKDITVSVLPGSGIANGIMTANAMCKNCRSWDGGKVDAADSKAPFIFATGPDEDLESNSLSAGVKRHANYGSFTLDLTKAMGSKSVPIAATADFAGTVQNSNKRDRDLAPPFHAFFMIFVFVCLLPAGVLILRVLNSPRWHGINQTISVVFAMIGVALGFYIGTLYNRSRGFNSAHQIFGIIIVAAMIGQFVLGVAHHRIFKQTGASNSMTPIHIWLGRLVIPCGIANGFLGFPLALNTRYNWALLILVLLIFVLAGPLVFWRYKRNARKKRNPHTHTGSTGYQAQPWLGASQSEVNLSHMQNYPLQNQTPQESRHFV
ncbi:hypothetical protein B0O99DRAFT_620456 [Bisporella sp. PMI_857]|nr:hypothetical protein B0O99DRAFT_620456 [Bisporella sp. PMI_857]